MIIKIIGSAFIVLASGLLGFYFSNIEGFRISDLLEMKRALSILRAEIEYSKMPLAEAVLNVYNRVKVPVRTIFKTFLELLKENKGVPVAELWSKAVGSVGKAAYFNKEDIEQLSAFGNALGFLDEDMQTKNIAITMNYIDDTIKALNEGRAKNKKMYQSLGVLSGLLLVIIFL